MVLSRLSRVLGPLIVTALVLSASPPGAVDAQGKKLKIGVVYDYTGPLAGGGSELQALGAKIMIDHFIKKGGVEGYQIEALYADAQSKPEVAKGNERGARKPGLYIVVKEGYAATAPDLASLVTKLKRARPDVILHTGYNPDITLFLRQARELGLRFSALIGHGAGYGVYDKLKESLGKDVNYFFNVDPISIWLTNEKALKPELPSMIKLIGDEYEKARPGTVGKSAHVGMGGRHS